MAQWNVSRTTATIAALAAGAGFLGLLLGVRVVSLTETDVIERVARDHIAAGGQIEDCVARPGADPIWIVVSCVSGDLQSIRAFNRLGWPVRLPDGTRQET